MDKNRFGALIALSTLTGCSAANASSLDPSDDLHCATIMIALEKKAEQNGADDNVMKHAFIIRSWYFNHIEERRLAEVPAVVASMNAYPDKVEAAGLACVDRAARQDDFESWASFAAEEFANAGRAN